MDFLALGGLLGRPLLRLALRGCAAHGVATLEIPEEWQPAEAVIDAGRLGPAAAAQLAAARAAAGELAPPLLPLRTLARFSGVGRL